MKAYPPGKGPARCALCAGALAALLAAGASADTVYLKKGGKITGVISSETENSIEVRSNLGSITLSRSAILRVERAGAEENQSLEVQWKKEKDEEQQKVREAKRFEEEQRSKGLVKYQGTWIPAEKAYEIEKGVSKQKEEMDRSVEQQRRELQDMEKRLKEIEARLDQRGRDLDFREQQLGLREQNLLLQQQNLQRQAEQLAREKQITPPKIFAIPRVEVVPPAGTQY